MQSQLQLAFTALHKRTSFFRYHNPTHNACCTRHTAVPQDIPAVLLWLGWRGLDFAAKLLLRLPAAAAAAAWPTLAPWGLCSQIGTEEGCLHSWRVLRSSSSSRTSCTTGCKMRHVASRWLWKPVKVGSTSHAACSATSCATRQSQVGAA